MKIKVDVTEITVYQEGTIHTVIIPYITTLKTSKPVLKNYFKSKFKVIELKRRRNTEIEVINDSVSQSIYEGFDNSLILGIDDSLVEVEREVK